MPTPVWTPPGSSVRSTRTRPEARAATLKAIRQADTKLWTTAPLYLWTAPGKKAKNVGLVDRYERVLVTGRRTPARTEIVIGGKARWVKAGYLAVKNPTPPPAPASAPASSALRLVRFLQPAAAAPAPAPASCSNGTSVASGVSPNVVKVHEAVCAAFPEITTYGTFRGDGEHAQGIAVDIMVSGSRGRGRGVRASQLLVARRELPHLRPADLVGRPRGRGLARHGGPRVHHGQPLRPRARHDLLRQPSSRRSFPGDP